MYSEQLDIEFLLQRKNSEKSSHPDYITNDIDTGFFIEEEHPEEDLSSGDTGFTTDDSVKSIQLSDQEQLSVAGYSENTDKVIPISSKTAAQSEKTLILEGKAVPTSAEEAHPEEDLSSGDIMFITEEAVDSIRSSNQEQLSVSDYPENADKVIPTSSTTVDQSEESLRLEGEAVPPSTEEAHPEEDLSSGDIMFITEEAVDSIRSSNQEQLSVSDYPENTDKVIPTSSPTVDQSEDALRLEGEAVPPSGDEEQPFSVKSDNKSSEPEALSSVEAFLKSETKHPTIRKKVTEHNQQKKRIRGQKKSKRSWVKSSQSLTLAFENQRLLGLDVGVSSVKYVHLKKIASGYKLLGLDKRSVEKPPLDASEEEKSVILAKNIRNCVNPKYLKNARVTSAVSGLEVVFKNLQIPKLKKKEMDKAVPWACRKDFPFPIETTQFEYQIIENKEVKSANKVDVFVVAAQKKLVAGFLNVLKVAGISPTKVSAVPAALCTLYKERKDKTLNGCQIMLDVGSESSHIVFINQNQLQFAREISTAGNDFTEALSGDIFFSGGDRQLSFEQAEILKMAYGIPQSDDDSAPTPEGIPVQEIAEMTMPVVERLTSEIHRTIEFYKEKFVIDSINGIFLTGGGALLLNLPAVLAKELGIKVQVLNPFDFISFKKFENQAKLQKIGPQYAVAIGLAIDRNKELNLLPATHKSSNALSYAKRIFKYVFLISILVMLLLYQDVSREFGKLQEEFQRTNAQFVAMQPKRKKFLTLQKEMRNLTSRQKAFYGKVHVDLSAANHLKAISHLVPPQIALTNLKIAFVRKPVDGKDQKETVQQILTMAGVAFENNSMEGINLAKFMLDLEKSGYFYSIRLRSQKVRKDGSMTFTIECEL